MGRKIPITAAQDARAVGPKRDRYGRRKDQPEGIKVLAEAFEAAHGKPKPKTLHGNVPTIYGGRRYDSRAEAHHAMNLSLMVAGGTVAWWIPQVRVELGPDNWTRVDFLVANVWRTDLGPNFTKLVLIEAHEVKGYETPRFAKIRKLWAKYAPFPMHVIKRGGEVEIIDGNP
jgi:hypothetical protein